MGPVVLCLLAVSSLLLAERHGAQAGIWIAKPAASMAFIWAALSSDGLATSYGALVFTGLLLCMLGDVLLIPRGRPGVFRAGVCAFLLGHVAYGAAFVTQALSPAGLVAGGVLLAVVLVRVLRWLRRELPAGMVVPVRAYMMAIGVMATLACGVTAAGGPWQVAVGALAFTVSDIAVARDRFVKEGFVNRAWGLPLYYGAQLLIAATPALVY
jgi:uncharacterized membrane protein YhhN